MAGTKNSWQDGAHNFRAFLLRCWQEEEPPDGKEPGVAFAWRFALIPIDDPSNGRGFARLEDLCACVLEELAAETNPSE